MKVYFPFWLPFGWRFMKNDPLNYRAAWIGIWSKRSLPLILWSKDDRYPRYSVSFPLIERAFRIGKFRPVRTPNPTDSKEQGDVAKEGGEG